MRIEPTVKQSDLREVNKVYRVTSIRREGEAILVTAVNNGDGVIISFPEGTTQPPVDASVYVRVEW
jgi:hypothetical protein